MLSVCAYSSGHGTPGDAVAFISAFLAGLERFLGDRRLEIS